MNEAFRLDREKTQIAPVRRRRWIVYIAIIAIVTAALTGAWIALRPHHTRDIVAVDPTPALTVTVTRPVPAIWPITLEASGAIAAWQEASIAPRSAAIA